MVRQTRRTWTLLESAASGAKQRCPEVRLAKLRKFLLQGIFLLHAERTLVFCNCELTYPSARVSIA